MSIEVSHNNYVFIMEAEQQVQVRAIVGWAAGFWGNVCVEDVQFHFISYACETLILDDRVARERWSVESSV